MNYKFLGYALGGFIAGKAQGELIARLKGRRKIAELNAQRMRAELQALAMWDALDQLYLGASHEEIVEKYEKNVALLKKVNAL